MRRRVVIELGSSIIGGSLLGKISRGLGETGDELWHYDDVERGTRYDK